MPPTATSAASRVSARIATSPLVLWSIWPLIVSVNSAPVMVCSGRRRFRAAVSISERRSATSTLIASVR